MVSWSVFVYARGVRRLDRPPTPEESYRRFVAMLREGRAGAEAKPEEPRLDEIRAIMGPHDPAGTPNLGLLIDERLATLPGSEPSRALPS